MQLTQPGWVARPKHGEDGFMRKGKFKKASNMNFALNTSCKVEEKLQKYVAQRVVQEKESHGLLLIDTQEEEEMYQRALAEVMAEDKRVKARGNIRMGEHILIVDSDTIVVCICYRHNHCYSANSYYSPRTAYSTAQQSCFSLLKLPSFNTPRV
jgi:hypothetical protein